jgi:predicted ATPase
VDGLLECIEEAEGAGVITSAVQYPEARFRFAHELIRRTIIEGHSAARRQRLHLNIAQATELLYANALEEHAEDLAHHFWSSGAAADPAKAVGYLQMAGEKAVRSSANVEAIGHFRKALQLIRILTETQERLRQELSLEISLGTALIATKGFSSREVEGVYARARELSQQVGQSPQFFRVLWGQWIHYASRAEWATAHELGDQCLQLGQSAGDPTLLIEAHHALGVSWTCEGEFVKALEHLDQTIALYDQGQHASLAFSYGQDPAAMCHLHAGHALWSLGYPDQALKRTNQGLALGRRLTHPGNLATISAWAALVQQFRRDARAVDELTETAVKISIEHDFAFTRGVGTILQGWALTQLSRREDGIAQMEQGLDGFRVTDAVQMVRYFSSLLAEAYGEAGRAREGLDLLVGLDPAREPYWEAELHRVKGELILKQAALQDTANASQAEAQNCFRQALAVARGQKAKSLELRAAMSLSRLWIKQGRSVDASRLMNDIFGWFTEGFDTPDLREAKELIDELRTHETSLSKAV